MNPNKKNINQAWKEQFKPGGWDWTQQKSNSNQKNTIQTRKIQFIPEKYDSNQKIAPHSRFN